MKRNRSEKKDTFLALHAAIAEILSDMDAEIATLEGKLSKARQVKCATYKEDDMFCSNCGTELSDEAKFCSNCGFEIKTKPPIDSPEDNLPRGDNVCPICKKSDGVQKISAIVDYGTQTLSGTTQAWVSQEKGGYWATTPISGTQVSDLARKLSAPIKPQAENFSCLILGIGLLFLGSGIMGSLYAILSIVAGIESEIFDSVVAALILLAIGIGIFKARKNHDERENKRVAVEEPVWEKNIAVWNRLYYCFRDDKVFDPVAQKAYSPQEIQKFYISSDKGE